MKSTISLFRYLALPTCAVLALTVSPAALAQDDQSVEEVVVTGSRIRQDPLEQSAPLLTLDAEDIKNSGVTSLGDFLQRLSVSGSPLTTRFNSSGNFGFPPDGGGIGAGASTVDLRNLGSKRTLVLVDGQRWVSESSASGVGTAVDLNTIPLSIIERIEVLEDGSSAIYGSDAIAGVVNVITKQDFDGFEISGYAGGYDEGGDTQEYSLSIGTVGDRSSVFLNIGVVDQERMNARDIPQSSTPIPFVTDGTGGSSGTPQARVLFTDPNTSTVVDCTLNDGVTGLPFYDPADPCGAGDDYHPFATADRFNFSPFNLVLTPSKRTSVYGQARYAFTPSTSVYLKGLFNNRESTNQAAPEPLFIGPDAGNGNLLDTITVDVTNPFNPFGVTLGENDPTFFAGRRPLEGGPRIFEQNVDTLYIGGGLQGEFTAGNRAYYWDLNTAKGRNRADQLKMGGYNSANLKQALGPVADCVAPCVPMNFFGGQGDGSGTITPEMLGFIGFIQKDLSEQELFTISGNISGEVVSYGAGSLAFAAGFEHREQDGFFQPDSVVTAGESAGVPSSPTAGGFDVDELYLEVDLPLLSDVPGAELLAISGAARNSDYSTFGDDTVTKFGLRWRPVGDLLFRGTVGEGLRAPSIGELFGSASRFDQTLADPCSDMLGLSGGNPASQDIVDSCIALGVPADGSYAQTNPQISVVTGGNMDLTPETSDSVTIGAVYAPSWVDNVDWSDGFSVEVTYWDHEVEGAIQAIDAQVQLDSCVNTLDPTLCGSINRNVTGTINGFSNQLTNIGGIETDGYDVNLTFVSPDTNIGQFAVGWYNTFLGDFTEIIPTAMGFEDVTREGTENGDPERGWPEFKSTLTTNWTLGQWSASWSLRYIDEITEACRGGILDSNPAFCSDPNTDDPQMSFNDLDATLYSDFTGTFRPAALDDSLEVTVGINNAFDEDPPTCFSCALNGFDAAIYDVPGRFLYIRAAWRQ